MEPPGVSREGQQGSCLIRARGIVALLSIALHGCVVVPVPSGPVTVSGRSLTAEEFSFLARGQTVRDEVTTQLGPPLQWLPRQRVLVYGAVRLDDVSILITTVGAGDLTTWRGMEREALLVAIDENDTVIDWAQIPVRARDSWLSTALQWGQDRGLDLAQPRQGFSLETPEPDESLVYVYRPLSKFLSRNLVVDVYGSRFALLTQLRSKSYALVRLEPGTRQIVVTAVLSESLARTVLLDLEPGSTYFVEIEMERGRGQTEPIVTERTQEEALPLLAELRETW